MDTTDDRGRVEVGSAPSTSASTPSEAHRPKRNDRDSSPEPEKVVRNGRLVSKKKANLPFLKQHRWPKPERKEKVAGMELRKKQGSPPPLERASEVSRTILRYSVVLVLGTLLLSRMMTETWTFGYEGKYTNLMNYIPRPMRTFTETELALYDGSDPSKPIYLALDGNVYDVSYNPRVYGVGGSYNHFAGKDAARAFVTGCFKTHSTHDTRGLSPKESKALQGWKDFFGNHAKYYRVGKVLHPPIDANSPIPPPCDPKAEGGTR